MARLRICGQRRKFKEGRWESDWWVLAGARAHPWFLSLAAAGAAGWWGAPRAGHCKQADTCFRKDLPGLCHLFFCSFITIEKTRKLTSSQRTEPLFLSDRAASPARTRRSKKQLQPRREAPARLGDAGDNRLFPFPPNAAGTMCLAWENL